jgi:hypothetical protein
MFIGATGTMVKVCIFFQQKFLLHCDDKEICNFLFFSVNSKNLKKKIPYFCKKLKIEEKRKNKTWLDVVKTERGPNSRGVRDG